MKFSADLHLHTDFHPNPNNHQGERPDRMAQAIVDANLDIFAITEHNQPNARFFDVAAEVQRLTDGTQRQIHGLLGVEISVTFEGYPYHVGYIFEDAFTRETLPQLPQRYSPITEFEAARSSHPSIAILYHPTLRDKRHRGATYDFMKSGLVDGVEIMNGSILTNGCSPKKSRLALIVYASMRKRGHLLAPIGASDAHRTQYVGSAVTEFSGERPEEIFEAVRAATTKAVARAPLAQSRIQQFMPRVHGIRKYIGEI